MCNVVSPDGILCSRKNAIIAVATTLNWLAPKQRDSKPFYAQTIKLLSPLVMNGENSPLNQDTAAILALAAAYLGYNKTEQAEEAIQLLDGKKLKTLFFKELSRIKKALACDDAGQRSSHASKTTGAPSPHLGS